MAMPGAFNTHRDRARSGAAIEFPCAIKGIEIVQIFINFAAKLSQKRGRQRTSASTIVC
jgi:hypothetical protein